MSTIKKILSVVLVLCLSLALLIDAAAANPYIGSVKKTADNKYQVSGGIDAYEPATQQLYVATYDAAGRMTNVSRVTPDQSGAWSYTGGASSAGQDVIKAFVVDGSAAPEGNNDTAVVVKTMLQLNAALGDGSSRSILIADNILLETAEPEKTIGINWNKSVTVSKGVTLTVPDGYTLRVNSGGRIIVAGTLTIAPTAIVDVSGSHTYLDGGNSARIPQGELQVLGTLSNQGTLIAGAAHTDTNQNYDGGSGGSIYGFGAEARFESTGQIQIFGGNTVSDPGDAFGARNNGGYLYISDATIALSGSARLVNDSMFIVGNSGILTGDGTVDNNNNMEVVGGSITGTLQFNNNNRLHLVTVYQDDGAGHITPKPSAVAGSVAFNGNGWISNAVRAYTAAALTSALAAGTGTPGQNLDPSLNVEYSGDPNLSVGSFSVPSRVNLSVFTRLTLGAGSTITVNGGTVNFYDAVSIPPDGALNIGKGGLVSVQCLGDGLANAGTITVSGALEIGKNYGGRGYLVNTGTITAMSGLLTVLPGSALDNSGAGTVTGTATLVSDGVTSGTAAAGITPETAALVTQADQLSGALSGGANAVYIANGFDIGGNVTVGKKLIVSKDAWLRNTQGAALTLDSDVWVFGWLENWGTVTVGAGHTLMLCGDCFNNDNGNNNPATIAVSGTLDLCPGKMLKNYGAITVSGGLIQVAGALCWGGQQAMPAFVGGYIKMNNGCIVPIYRTAASLSEYAVLMADDTCDYILLDFDMTIGSDTTFTKGLMLLHGRTLTVNSGATLTLRNTWLNINGSLINNGTVILANTGNNQQGRVVVNSGATLDTSGGTIQVYGQLQFNDRGSTTIIGESNITYHYYAHLRDFAVELAPVIADGYGLDPAAADEYAGAYKDWNNIDDQGRQPVAFILKNLSDTSLLESVREDGTYLEPYNWLTYGKLLQLFEQLWDAIKLTGSGTTDLPTAVSLTGKDAGDLVSVYDYGPGSELRQLRAKFAQAIGPVVVPNAATYTVNGSGTELGIFNRDFKEAVTVNWDLAKSTAVRNIYFVGCTFEKGITVVNSGENFWVYLTDCTLGTVAGKGCNVLVQPAFSGIDPVFDITDPSKEVIVNLFGSDGALVKAEQSPAHVASYVPGGAFTLNGVEYQGAAVLGTDGYFEGKYQLDPSDGGPTASFWAGNYTTAVTAGDTAFTNFGIWGSIRSSVTLDLDGALTSGGYLGLTDDNVDDAYAIIATGEVGDSMNDPNKMLYLYLKGFVDISHLTPYNANLNADRVSAVRLQDGGAWISPSIKGDYTSAAVEVAESDLISQGYLISLYKLVRDEQGNPSAQAVNGISVDYENSRTYIHSIGSPDELILRASYNGKAVSWHEIYRVFDNATLLDFAAALYGAFGSNGAFTPAGNAADFVTLNGLMTQVTDTPVTMRDVVKAFSAIAVKLEVTLNDYFTDNDLARVDYANGISYGAETEADILELASAMALSSSMMPNFTWDQDQGKEVLSVWFDGNRTIGKSTYDPNGNTQLSAMLEAFVTACSGSFYVGESPNITGATFEGPVPMSFGKSVWSSVRFDRCTFKDGLTAQALNITTDSGGRIEFNSCGFGGALSGFAVNLAPVTPNKYNNNNLGISNLPDGTKLRTTLVQVYAECTASEGILYMNGATVTAGVLNNSNFRAGIWWDDNEGVLKPCLGFGGGTASVNVPDGATAFMVFNADPDCQNDIALSIAAEWTPDLTRGLGLRNWSAHMLTVTGTIAGRTDVELPDTVELVGITDVTGLTLTGKCTLMAGKWQDLNQNHTVGGNTIVVLPHNDTGREIRITAGNTTGAISSAILGYIYKHSEGNVTINNIGGIMLTDGGDICLGDLSAAYSGAGTAFNGYTLTLYEGTVVDNALVWNPIAYTVRVEEIEGQNVAFLDPTEDLAVPHTVLLSVTDTSPDPDRTFNIAWTIQAESGPSGEADVTSAEQLFTALQDDAINKVNITGSFALGLIDSQPTTYTFDKNVDIKTGASLSIQDDVTLEINAGLIVNGTLSVAGEVHVYSWLFAPDNWDTHVQVSGTGMVYQYADLQTLAVDLYNRFSADYGLANTAGHDAYQSCYEADFFSNTDPAGITALNWLIENGVIPPDTINLSGWQKQTYASARALLDSLARKLEEKLLRDPLSITGYSAAGLADGDLLCCSYDGCPFDALLGSFTNAVGAISVADAVVYTAGLQGNLMNFSKSYAGSVTISCGDVSGENFVFDGCVFNGDLIINAGAGDKNDNIQLNGCTVNGDIIVKDNDGKSSVVFKDTVFSDPAASTVTVTEKTPGGAVSTGRLGENCDKVLLLDLPMGVKVTSSAVAVIVVLGTEGFISLNGVTIAGKLYDPDHENYTLAAATCWNQDTLVPVLIVAGDSGAIDATADAVHYKEFIIFTGTLVGQDTAILPESGSTITLKNQNNAFFSINLDASVVDTTVINDAGSYYIAVPTGLSATYQVDIGSGLATVTPADGKLPLAGYDGTTPVTLVITYTSGLTTTVTVKTPALAG
jgi:hypothetical protein